MKFSNNKFYFQGSGFNPLVEAIESGITMMLIDYIPSADMTQGFTSGLKNGSIIEYTDKKGNSIDLQLKDLRFGPLLNIAKGHSMIEFSIHRPPLESVCLTECERPLVRLLKWNGTSDLANRLFGESHGVDWKYVNQTTAIEVEGVTINEGDYIPTALIKNEFEFLSRLMIRFLCENHHPHTTIIISPTNAELLEGSRSTGEIQDYIKD